MGMNPSISVVIPTFNSSQVLQECIRSIKDQTFPAKEIIVCDANSSDGTAEIAMLNGAVVVSARPNRSLQRNTAVLATTSTYLLFVDSDMQLTETVLEECVLGMEEGVAGLVVPEYDIGRSYWAKVKGFERTFYKDAWWLQAARCLRKSDFMQIRGFDVGLIGPEDWDLDQRIRELGSVEKIQSSILHNESKIKFKGLIAKKKHYSNSFGDFQSKHPERFLLCFSKKNRIKLFCSKPLKLIAHPILTAGLIVLGFAEANSLRTISKNTRINTTEVPLTQSENPLK